MERLQRVDPLYEQIFKSIKKSIISGKLTPGERLIDTKLAAEFNVSRGPVREAFRKLEQSGMIENQDGIVCVFTPSLRDALELYQVRCGLESVAAYWTAKNINESKLFELKECLKLTEEAIGKRKMDEVICLNTQFHDCIISSSQNVRLEEMMKNIRSLIQLCRNTTIKQYNRSDSFLAEHYEVYRAIESRNPNLAAREMERHIHSDMAHFERSFSKQYEESIMN